MAWPGLELLSRSYTIDQLRRIARRRQEKMKTKRLSRHQSRSRIRTRRPSSLLLFTASQAPSHGSLRARATLMMMETAAIHLTTIVRARFASSSSSPFLSRPEKPSASASSRVTPIRRSQCRSTAFRSSRGPNRCLLSALATHHMSMEMTVRIKKLFCVVRRPEKTLFGFYVESLAARRSHT